MKIAMIGHKRIPSREGGVEIVVEELATRLVLQGHVVHAYNRGSRHVAGKQYGPAVQEKEYKGIRLLQIPTVNIRGMEAALYSFFATVRALFGGYDVLHFHALGSCVMLPLARLFGKKTVATVHGLDWQRAKWGGFARRYLLLGEKNIAKHADEVVVLSQNVQEYFLSTYGRKTTLVPNGIAAPQILPPQKITQNYGLVGEDYILFLSRIVPEKGLEYLLKAYSKLPCQTRLIVAGGSSHSSDYLASMQSLAASDSRVIMTGFVQGETLQELFSNCLVYVLPSDIEGMPISLLEAMSYGCRCLVSDIPENTQVTGVHGTSFQKSNVEDLQQVLGNMLALPPATLTQKQEISSYVLQQFNWDDTTQQHLNLYESALTNIKSKSRI